MERWCSKVALVTGATVGIGQAITKRLLIAGMKVVGCARNEDDLKTLHKTMEGSCTTGGCLETVRCDVSSEEQVLAMFKMINTKFGGLDVCINNAGIGLAAPILSGKTEDWLKMINVNILGVLMITREAVASMRAKKINEGHIINISSISGHRVLDNKDSSVYSATKFALTALSTATRQELLHEEDLNIRVSQVSPGLVETPFIAKKVGSEKAEALFNSFKALEADDIAQAVIFQLGLSPHAQVQDILIRGTEQQT